MSDKESISPAVPSPDDYEALLSDLRGIIDGARQQAAQAVNSAMVLAYWRIGERIVQAEQGGAARAGYGEQLLKRLGRALSLEFGRGFTEQSLRNMRQFYQAYKIRSALRSELSWTHYRILMRLEPDVRDFYERAAIAGRWSSRDLERQIGLQLHVRAALAAERGRPEPTMPTPRDRALTFEEAFKNPYILDFLGLEDTYSEHDLEAALIRDIEKFLLELGAGFTFMARQQRITVGCEDFYPDLVLYHRFMRCVVVVELKIGDFKPDYVGQMKLYLEWFRRYDKAEGESDPIGLILVGSRNQQMVELMLSDPGERIKVSQYLTTSNQEAIRAHLARLAEKHHRLTESDSPPEDLE